MELRDCSCGDCANFARRQSGMPIQTRCECSDCLRNHSESTCNRSRNESIHSEVRCYNEEFHQTQILRPWLQCRYGEQINNETGHSICTCYRVNRRMSRSELFLSTSRTSVESRRHTISSPIRDYRQELDTDRQIVYITFSDYSKRHKDEVGKLCEALTNSGFKVKADNYDAMRKKGVMNIHQWRDVNFRKAVWVLFCISPGYSECIRTMHDTNAHVIDNENEKAIIYIYNCARAEIYNSRYKSERFIPVLFTKTNASENDIPLFLLPFSKFLFPSEKNSLYEFLHTNRLSTMSK